MSSAREGDRREVLDGNSLVVRSNSMRRVAIVLVVVLLLFLLLIVPAGMGVGMPGMPCPDCALSAVPITCLVLLLGCATILSAGSSWRRLASTVPASSGDGRARVLERPPR